MITRFKQRRFRRRWARALRSGEYTQGRGVLCRVHDDHTEEWCCIGVGADVLGVPQTAFLNAIGDGSLQAYVLVAEAAGYGLEVQDKLIHLNDDADGEDFEGIANYIMGDMK